MAKHLYFISRPLHTYVQAQIYLNYSAKKKLVFKAGLWKLDPITHIAQIQGIALFNQVFFEILEKKSFKDPKSQWKVYSRLVLDRQFIIEVCEHSKLLDIFILEESNSFDRGEIYFTAFCIILWDIHCKKETKKAKQIIRSFIEHYFGQLFPKKQKMQLTKIELIENICQALYLKWGVKPEIKESFKTTKDSVKFSLIAKTTHYYPAVLITLDGKRLKSTRKKCYKTLDNLLKNELSTIPELMPKIPKKFKNQAIK